MAASRRSTRSALNLSSLEIRSAEHSAPLWWVSLYAQPTLHGRDVVGWVDPGKGRGLPITPGGNNGENGRMSLRAVAGDHFGRAGQRLCLSLQGLPAPHRR